MTDHDTGGSERDPLSEPAISWLKEGEGVTSGEPTDLPQAGPYRLIRELGAGGMGVVYEAERSDGAYEQQVAVKVLSVRAQPYLQLFQSERQILATLEHPGIARLLDAGETSDGRPYLVMERVEGRPLDEFAAEQDLSVQQKVELLLQVCEAVAYAHRRLVVHRDLKPRNILVTPEGQPKLLDFGIAKVLAEGDSGGRHTTAVSALRALTPAYASPEQLLGEPVTTASDVFSLGVVLHGLLFGSAREVQGSAMESAASVAESVRALQMSAIAGSKQLDASPQLSEDLGRVVAHALSMDQSERYGRVEDLAEDLRRCLASLPISARRRTVWYLTQRFLRRHRRSVAGGLVVSAALVAGVAVIAGQASSLRTQRDLLRERNDQLQVQRLQAEQAAEFTVELLQLADPFENPSEAQAAAPFLESALERALEADLSESVRGVQLRTLGWILVQQGRYDLADRAFRTALSSLAGDSTTPTEQARVRLAAARYGLANQGLADAEEALKVLREELDAADVQRLESELLMGWVYWYQGRTAEAGVLIEQMQPGLERSGSRIVLQELLSLKGLVASSLGDVETSARYLRECAEMAVEVYGRESPHYAQALSNLGMTLTEGAQLEEAAEVLTESVETYRRYLRNDHNLPTTAFNNLGRVLADLGRPEEACEWFQKAVEISHPSDLPLFLSNRASCLVDLGEFEEALGAAERGVDLDPELADWGINAALWAGRAALLLGDLSKAEVRFASVADRLREVDFETSSSFVLRSLGTAHWGLGLIERVRSGRGDEQFEHAVSTVCETDRSGASMRRTCALARLGAGDETGFLQELEGLEVHPYPDFRLASSLPGLSERVREELQRWDSISRHR